MPLHVSIVSVKNYKYIRVYSSYRNEKGQPRSRLIENHGRLDTALSKDPQYVEKLKERIAKENQLEASTKAVNFQRFPTLDAKKLVNAPKMSAHHRGICHF